MFKKKLNNPFTPGEGLIPGFIAGREQEIVHINRILEILLKIRKSGKKNKLSPKSPLF